MKLAIIIIVSGILTAAAAGQTVWYVPDDFPGGIQSALSDPSVVDHDTVVVRPGTYVENIDFLGKAVTLTSEQGPAATVIDGGQAGSVVSFISGEGPDAVLEGFTVTNGSGNYYPVFDEYNGGGVLCDHASPTVRGNVIAGNEVRDIGAGLFCYRSAALIADNEILANVAHGSGGAIYSYQASPTISGNTIDSNTADRYGGGVRSRFSTLTVTGNVIRNNASVRDGGGLSIASLSGGAVTGNTIAGNLSDDDGGGIFCEDSSPEIAMNVVTGNEAGDDGGGFFGYLFAADCVNNIFSGNTAGDEGGGFQFVDSGSAIINNTVWGNSAAKGGGIGCYNAAITVYNTILWDNDAPTGEEAWLAFPPSSLEISHSDVEGGMASVFVEPGCDLVWGSGILESAPLLADPAAGDFNLTILSPCANAGDDTVNGLPAEDISGDPRITGATVDIGADEFWFHLYHLGEVVPGGDIDIKIIGVTGNPVRIFRSTTLQDPPQSTPYGDLFLAQPFKNKWAPGAIPADGILIWEITLPAGLSPGALIYLQALVGNPGDTNTKLTNLMTLEVM